MHSLELTIAGASHAAKVFRAVKVFDASADMGPTLRCLRNREPITIELDRPDRSQILGRLIELLDTLEQMGVEYEVVANNVPRSSHLWKLTNWTKLDIERAHVEATAYAAERELVAKKLRDYQPPEPPPSRTLLEQRWRDIPFDDLMPSERAYITLWALRAEVNNGGFATYFHNSAGDSAIDAQSALEAINAKDVRSILSDAIQILESVGGYSPDRMTRWTIANRLPENVFLEVNSRFYETREDIVALAFDRVETEYKTLGLIASE